MAILRSKTPKARLIVLVSHDLQALFDLCDRIIWLDQGRVRDTGPPRAMIEAYLQHTSPLAA